MRYVMLFALTVTVLSSAELLLLLYVASQTSFLLTLFLCILTGLVGGSLIRWQGLETLARLQLELQEGRLPTNEIIGGLLLVVMGVLLAVPGFITDTLGFLIVIPGVRAVVARAIQRRIEAGIRSGSLRVSAQQGLWGWSRGGRPGASDPSIVDAEFTVEDETPRRPLP